jgi:hypothetical protein
MARGHRIGILTGGGDVPGLNSVIKSVVYRGTEMGHDVVGIRRGWEGLTHSVATGRTDSSVSTLQLPDDDRRRTAAHVPDDPHKMKPVASHPTSPSGRTPDRRGWI